MAQYERALKFNRKQKSLDQLTSLHSQFQIRFKTHTTRLNMLGSWHWAIWFLPNKLGHNPYLGSSLMFQEGCIQEVGQILDTLLVTYYVYCPLFKPCEAENILSNIFPLFSYISVHFWWCVNSNAKSTGSISSSFSLKISSIEKSYTYLMHGINQQL
jgi:hypothetical protein